MKKIEIAAAPSGMLLPIYKRLGEAGFRFWSPTPEWAKAMVDSDLEAKPLGEMVGRKNLSDRAYLDAAAVLRRGVDDFANGTGPGQAGLSPNASAFIGDKAPAFLYARLFDVCALVRALDETDVRLVVVPDDVQPQTRALCLWARTRNIPSLHVPHAVYQNIHRDPMPGTDVHDLVTASHLASAGPFQTDWYVQRGFSSENVREVGRPTLDAWARNEWRMDRKRARRQLRIPSEAVVVTYCSTWPQGTQAATLGQNEEWVWAYHAFLEATANMNVVPVVSCHPGGGTRGLQWHLDEAVKFSGRTHKKYKICDGANLPSVLWASDAVVAFGGSNVMGEASFVPGLRLLNTHGYEGEAAVARAPMDMDGMREALEISLDGKQPDVGGFRARYFGEADGGAADRVARWCVELVR